MHSSSGLILWFGESSSWRKNRDYLTIGLNDGHINVDLNLDINNKRGHNLNSKRFIVNNTRIDDGQWHRLNVIRIGQQIIIHIDDNITVRGLIDGDEHNYHDNNNVQSALYLGKFFFVKDDSIRIFSKFFTHTHTSIQVD